MCILLLWYDFGAFHVLLKEGLRLQFTIVDLSNKLGFHKTCVKKLPKFDLHNHEKEKRTETETRKSISNKESKTRSGDTRLLGLDPKQILHPRLELLLLVQSTIREDYSHQFQQLLSTHQEFSLTRIPLNFSLIFPGNKHSRENPITPKNFLPLENSLSNSRVITKLKFVISLILLNTSSVICYINSQQESDN